MPSTSSEENGRYRPMTGVVSSIDESVVCVVRTQPLVADIADRARSGVLVKNSVVPI
jgi:hypothetical protein